MSVSELERIGREAGVYWSAAELMAADFPEPRWAVPGLIPEGLTLLVGSPKFGKSWMCLGLAVAVASGGRALGRIPVERGAVLYAALEDPGRRLQSRLSTVLAGAPVPPDLSLVTNLPRLPQLTDFLGGWLDTHPDARLVIIDVLRKVRPISDGKGNAYFEDYDTLGSLKELSDRYGVAIVVVHHSRKAADEADVFGEVSGSTGLTGAADGLLYAKRARNTAEAVLHVTGRDIDEHEYGLTWDKRTCQWTVSDEPAVLATMAPTRRTILDDLTDHPLSTPVEVAERTGITLNTVQQTVRRMVTDDQLDSDGQGRYLPHVSLSAVSAVSVIPFPTDSTDRTDTYTEGVR